jgi:hypothetical protein
VRPVDRPERVAQRPAGQREAERVVLVHCVGDEAKAAAGVEQGEGGCGQRGHSGAATKVDSITRELITVHCFLARELLTLVQLITDPVAFSWF